MHIERASLQNIGRLIQDVKRYTTDREMKFKKTHSLTDLNCDILASMKANVEEVRARVRAFLSESNRYDFGREDIEHLVSDERLIDTIKHVLVREHQYGIDTDVIQAALYELLCQAPEDLSNSFLRARLNKDLRHVQQVSQAATRYATASSIYVRDRMYDSRHLSDSGLETVRKPLRLFADALRRVHHLSA